MDRHHNRDRARNELLRQISLRVLEASGPHGTSSLPQWTESAELAYLVGFYWGSAVRRPKDTVVRCLQLVELADYFEQGDGPDYG